MYRSLILLLLLVACDGGDDDAPPVARAYSVVVEPYEPGAIFSVWGSGPNNLWMVGGEQGAPVVLRYDGTAFTRNDPPIGQQLWWVHGFPNGPVYVAGEGGALARFDAAMGWQVFDAGFGGTTFYGIWGSAPDDVYAVGGKSQTAPVDQQVGDVIAHFDGTTWERISLPILEMKPASAQTDLFKVWGTARDRVFIVGSSGLVLAYDGTSWTKQDAGLGNEPLFTVFGRTADDVYAVGGLGSSVLIHFDGTSWSSIELPEEAPPVIQGLWTAPGEPVFVSGYYGFLAEYEGGEWLVSDPPSDLAFHGLFGVGGVIYAGGGNITSFSPDYQGVVAVSGRNLPPP